MVDSLENEGLEPLEWRFGSNDFPDFTWFLRTCAGNPHPQSPIPTYPYRIPLPNQRLFQDTSYSYSNPDRSEGTK